MLAQRMKQWTEQWLEEGREEGREEGQASEAQSNLCRTIELRFGPDVLKTALPFVTAIQDQAILNELRDIAVTTDSPDALIAALHQR